MNDGLVLLNNWILFNRKYIKLQLKTILLLCLQIEYISKKLYKYRTQLVVLKTKRKKFNIIYMKTIG